MVGDYRNPDLWRLGLSPLTTSYAEVWHAVEAARDWLEREQMSGQRAGVAS